MAVQKDFFSNPSDTPLSGNWSMFGFDFTADTQVVDNDDPIKGLEYSFDGGRKHGILTAGESITKNEHRRNKIYLRDGGLSGTSYRLFAWSKN